MASSVEGLHYIFDRYAFLNNIMEDGGNDLRVNEASSPKDFETVIRLARALNHPDKFIRAGKKLQEDAAKRTLQIEDVGRVLLSPQLKAVFDDKLAKFRIEKPSYISRSGEPIYILGDEHFDIDSLLSGSEPNTSQLEKSALNQTGYNPALFKVMESHYRSDPSEQNKELYAQVLSTKLCYLLTLEEAGWQRVGIMFRDKKNDEFVMDAGNYVASVQNMLDYFQDHHVVAAIQERCDDLRIGFTQDATLLLSFNGAATHGTAISPILDEDIQAKMTETARRNFQERSQFLIDVAAEKQKVLQELVELSPLKVLRQDASSDIHYIYLMFDGEEGHAAAWASLNVQTGQVTPEDFILDRGWTKEDIINSHEGEGTIYLLYHNDNIPDYWMEMTAAFNRIYAQSKAQPTIHHDHPKREP